ncbi:MAG TPA: hypothetical protein VEI74_14730, partial [Candidatus Methylomirabilis sp.]|nr:hypothetical protein [Candidatus Methylomirabilis sp.]
HIDNPKWQHNVDHRQGVPYKDQAVAQRYNRGVSDQAARSRDDYRGRADSGRAEMQTRDRGQPQSRPDASVQARSSGFSGVDHGASTRAASARGSMSRGGGGGRGGGRR